MEELNKTQLILLTLLVTFVTSISSSIITTALLAEAPVSVTQTINRVVERTIEKAVPTDRDPESLLSPEDRALLAALDNVSQATVSVGKLGEDGKAKALSIGVILSNDGLIITSRGGITATTTASYVAILSDKSVIPLSLVKVGEEDDIAVFQVATSTPAAPEDSAN
jgi:hypothetical protein